MQTKRRQSLSSFSVPFEGLLQPFGDHGWDNFGVYQQRLAAVAGKPLRSRRQVLGFSDRESLEPAGAGNRGEVRLREADDVRRLAEGPEMVDLGAVSGVVVDDDKEVEAEPGHRLELRQRHQEPAIAEGGNSQS